MMAYAISYHEYNDIIMLRLTGRWLREVEIIRSDKCLVCDKPKEAHARQPRTDKYY
jgi:hypothetical protein